jgi:Tol biopolymer transport system component
VTRPSAPGRSARNAFSVGPLGRWIAPALSVVGLLVVAIVTLNLLNGQVPFVGGTSGNGTGNGTGNGNGGAVQTPAPSNVVVVPEVVTFKGSIVYAKAGNIWVQSGKDAHQLTTSGDDSMPSWSPDGTTVYFIRTVPGEGRAVSQGVVRDYLLSTPSVMRVKADGSAEPERVLSGKVTKNGRTWHAWIREPVLSPDGKTLAIVSDRPDPSVSDVVLQFYDLSTKKSRVPKLAETPPLGHQDPDWRSDGKELLYVRNGRSGARGAPVIYRWSAVSSKASAVTGPGYLEPSYSPDGRYIAATKTSGFGNDLVILDASNGREVLRLTTDGASWAPTWSPLGDSIAFMHIKGQIVDLKLVRLDGAAPNWTVKDITDLTEVSGLDGESRPDWFVPADQLPKPTSAPSVAPSGAAPSAAASPAS